MTTLTYSMNRQQAADFLGVSTRTIDRYVVKWSIRYKKIANKVVLAKEDLEKLQEELELVQQPTSMPTTVESSTPAAGGQKSPSVQWNSLKEFVDLLHEKDKTIEDKNSIIFALQHQIGQMESRLQQVIALPDYTQEKTELEHTIQSLETEKTLLEDQVKREKLRNTVYMWLILIAGAVVAVLIL